MFRDLNRLRKWNQEKHLSSIRGTEADVSAEDLNSDPRGRNHLAAPQSETNTHPDLPSTNLRDRMGLFMTGCSAVRKNIIFIYHRYTE